MAAFLPFIPAALSAIGGGVAGAAGGAGKRKKVSRFDKQQQGLFSDFGNSFSGQGQFADLVAPFDEQAARARFEQSVAQPAIQQFQQQIVPGITGEFRGKNLGESSFLGQALTEGGSNLESRLAAQLGETLFQGREAWLDRRMQALQNFLQSQTFDFQDPERSKFDRIIGGIGQGLTAGSKLFPSSGGGG